MPSSHPLTLQATVVAGRGLGSSTVEQNATTLEKMLSAPPFPGTLNLITLEPFKLLQGIPYDKKKKHYAIPVVLNDTACLLSAGKSFPLHVYEVIAPVSLRQELGLEDGEIVTLKTDSQNISAVTGWKRKLWELLYCGREDAYYKDTVFKRLTKSIFFRKAHKLICHGNIKEIK